MGLFAPSSLLLLGCTLVGGPTGASSPPDDEFPGASESPVVLSPVTARRPPAHPTAWVETGVASWYGEPFHGRPTSSGEIYDMNDLTCAHPSLPFGTRLRVQNLDNGRMATVRINDRGPFAKGRIVDVSKRAAEELGMIGPGTARVRITVLAPAGA